MNGQSLRHYRMTAKLGAGGMGDVYRATDTRLGREVAIKTLPEEYSSDPKRLGRFEREAKVLASLNHPHIAQIYGLEEDDGRRFLVLELVEGATLAKRIGRGPIPIKESLSIALQIAEALEAAHGRGIIHRDLKPANLMLDPDGQAKVLDFGIAKPARTATADRTRTLTRPPTRAGVLMGTPTYMSPEQVRGQGVDKRSDIWAFGVVLWEMLTGARLFEGDTDSDILLAVMQVTPTWQDLPPETPRAVLRLLRRCLEREPKVRLHDIADARLEIEEAIADPERASATVEERPEPTFWRKARAAWPALLTVFALGLLIAGAAWKFLGVTPTAHRKPLRLGLAVPPGATIRAVERPVLAVSPDGRWLVFKAFDGGTTRLFKRSLEQFEATPIPDTEYAYHPFFSPDGRWVGFFAQGKLKKVSLVEGSPHVLCDADNPWGATWGPDGNIIFTPTDAGELWRVAAVGGEPEPLLIPDPREGVWGYYWPEVLPDGKAVLYTAWPGLTAASAHIGVFDLESRERKTLIENASYARYLPTGHLIYGRDSRVEVVPFDIERRAVTGPSVPVPEPIFYEPENGVPHLAFSTHGSLAFVPGGGTPQRRLVWVDLEGNEEPVSTRARGFVYPRFSPTGDRLAVTISESGNSNIWVLDLETGAQMKLPVEGNNAFPVWSPDGERIVFSAETTQPPASWSLFSKRVQGTGAAEPLLRAEEAGQQLYPYSWSPDGRTLVIGKDSTISPESREDIWFLPIESDRETRPFVATEVTEVCGAVSPDGHWIAYVSRESGYRQVYVQRFPDGGEKHQVSTGPGVEPVWSPDGLAIYYWGPGGLMAAPVSTTPPFQLGAPKTLFEGQYAQPMWTNFQNFDVSPDGNRFVMIKADESWGRATGIGVVLNWFEELKRLAPPDGAR